MRFVPKPRTDEEYRKALEYWQKLKPKTPAQHAARLKHIKLYTSKIAAA